jgi:hypothetical protein
MVREFECWSLHIHGRNFIATFRKKERIRTDAAAEVKDSAETMRR